MSRKTLRYAAATFFSQIPNLDLLPAQDFFQQSEHPTLSGSGATGYVYIMGDEEMQGRLTGSPQTGIETRYTVVLVVEFESGAESPTYMDDHDDMIQNIKTQLRSDPTLGTQAIQGQPGAVWQAGKGDGSGQFDVRVFSELPETDDDQAGVVRIRTSVEFMAIEQVLVAGG